MEKIQKIIEKIRLMAKYNPQIKKLVAEQNATIRRQEEENGETAEGDECKDDKNNENTLMK